MGRKYQQEIARISKRLSAACPVSLTGWLSAIAPSYRSCGKFTAATHQRQSRISVFPGGFQPDVIGIFGDGQGPGSSGEEIEVVDIVAGTRDDGMKTGPHEDRIAILRAEGDVASKIGRVETLECKAFFRAADAVVVDFVEVDFGGGIVDVVFVGRKAGPVAAGSVHLDDDEFVGGEVRAGDVHDLARSVSTATEAANDVFWGDQFGLEFYFGRNAAFGNFADGFGLESDGMIRGEIEAIGQAVKNIFTLADGVRAFAPIYCATATQKNEGGFFTLRGGGITFAGIQTAGGHAHPFPLDAFAGKVEQLAGVAFGERAGMDDVRSCSHEAPQAAPGFPGKSGSGKATVSAGKNQSALPSGLTVAGSNWKSVLEAKGFRV